MTRRLTVALLFIGAVACAGCGGSGAPSGAAGAAAGRTSSSTGASGSTSAGASASTGTGASSGASASSSASSAAGASTSSSSGTAGTGGTVGTSVSAGTGTTSTSASAGSSSSASTSTSTSASGAPALPAPVIGRIDPPEGVAGTSVTIFGSGFVPNPALVDVDFAGVPGAVLTASDTQITLAVPSGAWTGAVRVTCNGGSSNAWIFRVPGSRGQAPLAGPPLPGNPGALAPVEGPLAAKAREYQRVLEAFHEPDGLILGAVYDPTFTSIQWYDGFGDAAIWTGTYLAAECFRYAATGDQAALSEARKSIQALQDLMDITGVPGLIGRAFVRNSTQTFTQAQSNDPIHDGTGRFTGYQWFGSVSRDQYTGYMLGLSVAYDLLPDPVLKAQCAGLITAVADFLIANDYSIRDVDGKITKYGDYSLVNILGFKVPYPLHAMLVIGWIRAAEHVSGDPRYTTAAQDLIFGRGLGTIVEQGLLLEAYAFTFWFNVNLGFSGLYTLLRNEYDPSARAHFLGALENRVWAANISIGGVHFLEPARDTLNPWFAFLYGSMSANGPDWLASYEGIWQLESFDAPPHRDRWVDSTALVSVDPIAKALGHDQALEPLRVDLRPQSDFQWQRNPFLYKGGGSTLEYAGVDYLAGYWLGRYLGQLPPDM